MPRFADVILPLPARRPLYLPHTRGVAGESRHRQPCHRTLRAQTFLHRHRSRPAQHRAARLRNQGALDPARQCTGPAPAAAAFLEMDCRLLPLLGGATSFKAAVPSGLKIESETQIACNDDFIEDTDSPLKEREAVLLDTPAAERQDEHTGARKG